MNIEYNLKINRYTGDVLASGNDAENMFLVIYLCSISWMNVFEKVFPVNCILFKRILKKKSVVRLKDTAADKWMVG